MTGKFKTLGAALVVALAIGATTASSASAEAFLFTSEASHTTLVGESEGTETFTVDAGSATCTGTEFNGTVSGEDIAEVALSPTYGGCTADPLGIAEVTPNGCAFVFGAWEVVEGGNQADARIECPAAKSITTTVKVLGVTKCTIHVGAQTGLEKITVAETGSPGSLKSTVELSGIAYSQTAGTGLGACANASKANGTYKTTVTIDGFEGEAQVGIGVVQGGKIIELFPKKVDFEVKGAGTKKPLGVFNLTKNNITIVEVVSNDDAKYKATKNCNGAPLTAAGTEGEVCEVGVTCEANGAVGTVVARAVGGGFDIARMEKC